MVRVCPTSCVLIRRAGEDDSDTSYVCVPSCSCPLPLLLPLSNVLCTHECSYNWDLFNSLLESHRYTSCASIHQRKWHWICPICNPFSPTAFQHESGGDYRIPFLFGCSPCFCRTRKCIWVWPGTSSPFGSKRRSSLSSWWFWTAWLSPTTPRSGCSSDRCSLGRAPERPRSAPWPSEWCRR